MTLLVLAGLIFAITGHSDATWCACKDGLSDGVLQKTLDYACGAGADCNPIKQNGACYNPTTVRAHCSYAVNSYFQKKGQAAGSCDFAGTATVTASNPSSSSLCVYPTSGSTHNSIRAGGLTFCSRDGCQLCVSCQDSRYLSSALIAPLAQLQPVELHPQRRQPPQQHHRPPLPPLHLRRRPQES